MSLALNVFGGGWQTVIDAFRVITIALGVMVTVLAAHSAVNPEKRQVLPSTRPGTIALTLFAVSASFTEIGRLGHDMGYWRLPVNFVGLMVSVVTCYRISKVPTARDLYSHALNERVDERLVALQQSVDEAAVIGPVSQRRERPIRVKK